MTCRAEFKVFIAVKLPPRRRERIDVWVKRVVAVSRWNVRNLRQKEADKLLTGR